MRLARYRLWFLLLRQLCKRPRWRAFWAGLMAADARGEGGAGLGALGVHEMDGLLILPVQRLPRCARVYDIAIMNIFWSYS